MSHRLTALALAATLAGFTIAAEDAEHCRPMLEGDTAVERGVDACTEQVWFHAAEAPIGNLAGAGAGTPTFDGTEPGSGGGAYVTTSAAHQQGYQYDPVESATFTGTFEGGIETLLVSLYLLPPAGVAQGEATFRVDARLTIDGQAMGMLDDKSVPFEDGGNIQRIDFGWIRIDTRMSALEMSLDGTHEVTLSFHGTGIATNGAVVAYDSSDYPSGMVFNVDVTDLDPILFGRA